MLEISQTLAWKDVATWAFCGGWSFIFLFVARSIKDLSETARKMEGTVAELNKNLAVMAEKVGNHESRIEKLEERE